MPLVHKTGNFPVQKVREDLSKKVTVSSPGGWRVNPVKDQGGGLMSEDRFKCPRCSRNEKGRVRVVEGHNLQRAN